MKWQDINIAPENEWLWVYCPWVDKVAAAIYRNSKPHGNGKHTKIGWQVHFLDGYRTYLPVGTEPSHWMFPPEKPSRESGVKVNE